MSLMEQIHSTHFLSKLRWDKMEISCNLRLCVRTTHCCTIYKMTAPRIVNETILNCLWMSTGAINGMYCVSGYWICVTSFVFTLCHYAFPFFRLCVSLWFCVLCRVLNNFCCQLLIVSISLWSIWVCTNFHPFPNWKPHKSRFRLSTNLIFSLSISICGQHVLHISCNFMWVKWYLVSLILSILLITQSAVKEKWNENHILLRVLVIE